MSPTLAGLIGLVLGLALAAVEVFVVLPRLAASLQRTADTMAGPERARAVTGIRVIRIAFLAQLVIYPVVGFGVGWMLA